MPTGGEAHSERLKDSNSQNNNGEIAEAKCCESLNFYSRGERKRLGILSQVGLLPIHIEASKSTTFSTDQTLKLYILKTGAEPHPSFFKRYSDVEQWQFAGLICWHPDVLRSRLSIANIFAFRAKSVVFVPPLSNGSNSGNNPENIDLDSTKDNY